MNVQISRNESRTAALMRGRRRSVTKMSMFISRDLIAERLEIAHTLGVVTKYVVRPTQAGEESSPAVQVWPSAGVNEKTIGDYLARLLDGLIPRHQVVVTGDAEAPVVPAAGAEISAAA